MFLGNTTSLPVSGKSFVLQAGSASPLPSPGVLPRQLRARAPLKRNVPRTRELALM